jgi:collagenase-like PrtC family protease
MRLTVTTNWADDFIDRVAEFQEVEWIRGRLFKDEIGGLMNPANFAKRPTKKTVEKAIKKIHSMGRKFCYAIDAYCMENKEYSWEGQKKILELIKWIEDSGADAVNVVAPHLVEVVKEQFPHLKVEFGSSIAIGEIKRIKYFDKLGVDSIILRPDFNRNFQVLSMFKDAISCTLKLIANSICMFWCNFASDHNNLLSHISNFTTKSKYSRYYNYVCNRYRLDKPAEILKAGFIRPEDIEIYQSRGFSNFVLELNSSNTDDMVRILRAYASRRYEGNLFEIMSSGGEKLFQDDRGRIEKGAPQLDNRKLDDFLRYFIEGGICYYAICGMECQYCKEKIEEVIEYSAKPLKVLKIGIQERIDKIENGIFT